MTPDCPERKKIEEFVEKAIMDVIREYSHIWISRAAKSYVRSELHPEITEGIEQILKGIRK